MYIKNNQNKDVKLTSFEGYAFRVPKGVSWIWDKAGEDLVKRYALNGENGVLKNTGAGIPQFVPAIPPNPAIEEATKEEWIKGGKMLSEASRFQIDSEQFTSKNRDKLVEIALQRGLDRERVMEFQINKTIEVETIIQEINDLPIPEDMKYPKDLEQVEQVDA